MDWLTLKPINHSINQYTSTLLNTLAVLSNVVFRFVAIFAWISSSWNLFVWLFGAFSSTPTMMDTTAVFLWSIISFHRLYVVYNKATKSLSLIVQQFSWNLFKGIMKYYLHSNEYKWHYPLHLMFLQWLNFNFQFLIRDNIFWSNQNLFCSGVSISYWSQFSDPGLS